MVNELAAIKRGYPCRRKDKFGGRGFLIMLNVPVKALDKFLVRHACHCKLGCAVYRLDNGTEFGVPPLCHKVVQLVYGVKKNEAVLKHLRYFIKKIVKCVAAFYAH